MSRGGGNEGAHKVRVWQPAGESSGVGEVGVSGGDGIGGGAGAGDGGGVGRPLLRALEDVQLIQLHAIPGARRPRLLLLPDLVCSRLHFVSRVRGRGRGGGGEQK